MAEGTPLLRPPKACPTASWCFIGSHGECPDKLARVIPGAPEKVDMMRSPLARLPTTRQPNEKVDALVMSRTPHASKSSRLVALTPSRYALYEGDAFEFERLLGRGAFGLVTLMSRRDDGVCVAMKTVDRFRLTTSVLRRMVEHEIHVLRHVVPAHAGIVPLLEVIETRRSIHMVFAYAELGTLEAHVRERGALSEPQSRALAAQCCAAGMCRPTEASDQPAARRSAPCARVAPRSRPPACAPRVPS
jgi:hypothetical protein